MTDWKLFCEATIVAMIAVAVAWFVTMAATWNPSGQTVRYEGPREQTPTATPESETNIDQVASAGGIGGTAGIRAPPAEAKRRG